MHINFCLMYLTKLNRTYAPNSHDTNDLNRRNVYSAFLAANVQPLLNSFLSILPAPHVFSSYPAYDTQRTPSLTHSFKGLFAHFFLGIFVKGCLERIVLRGDLVCEELVEDGDLLHDVVAHLGDLGEEKESEESGYATETAGEYATVARRNQVSILLMDLAIVQRRENRLGTVLRGVSRKEELTYAFMRWLAVMPW